MKITGMLLSGVALMAVSSCQADGEVRLQFEEGAVAEKPSQLQITYSLLEDVLNARRGQQPKEYTEVVDLKGNDAEFRINATGWARYSVSVGQDESVEFVAKPGENISITVSSLTPELKYVVTGSELTDQMNSLDEQLIPVEQEFVALRESGSNDMAAMEGIIARYNQIAADYVRKNADKLAAPYALMVYDGDEYPELYSLLKGDALSSPYYKAAGKKNEAVKANLEKQRRQEALSSGNVDAPNFRLKNLEGKEVSLSDFRGKYVVLDFWGSWCPWCIKGFPSLKEAYTKYAGKIEIIGVDCGDSDADWRAAVERFKLPWVNLYNPQDSKVLEEYGVSGFPTKAIVNPEGKIVNITVGEDPAFFTKLAELVK